MRLVEAAFGNRKTVILRDACITLHIGSESGTEIVALLDSTKQLSDTDRALLGIFCDRLSASLDNLVLYEQLQEANRTLEERVALRTRELASANRRLYEQWQHARRGRALQSEILGTVAHDLKNPLSVVLGRTEILAELLGMTPFAAERCLAQVEQVKESTRRMTAMVDRLVAEAMEDALDIVIRREPGDLLRLVDEVVQANQPLVERKKQMLEIETGAANAASFDYDRMRDALDNLVSNAIKYSPVGEKIRVLVESDDDHVLIRVVDCGPGLWPEDFSRLFGRFQRLSAKPTGGETSTGLGLFSAKRIVDLHGGAIWAESQGPGRGTTFTIRLPADREMVR
jgi:signal transduction histidine kinase